MCDEITDVKETNFIGKDITSKTQNFYILLAFLLITSSLLIAVISIYCYLIRNQAKQKHLLPLRSTKLKKSLY